MAKYTGRSGAAARASGVNVDRPDIQARKSAAASMKSAGVQSLSGLSGSQGQVARFKTEQNQLRNEYNDKNTSDDRKEEIVKDLRGVSRNLNDQSRAAALNQVIREFGPGSVTNTGGIMGADAGARFQQLRGNPNFYQDGRPGLETFVGNQGAFKTGDKNLFKQVHPNPLKILLGAATQAGNISPLGLVRNINKIRTGQPLIDLSFMDRNTSESPSRMKDFYSAYMKEMNKKIADAKSSKNAEQFDAVDMDPGFRKFMPTQLETEDLNLDPAILLARDEETNRYGTPAGAEPGATTDIDDEEFASLLNQYSLLNQDDLATSLLDETDLEKEINPNDETVVEKMERKDVQYVPEPIPGPTTDYEQEFLDTFGTPMVGNIEVPSLARPGEMERGLGDRLIRESFALDNNIPLDQIGEIYPKTATYPLPSNIMKDGDLTAGYYNPTGDFNYGDYGIDDDVIFSDRISNMPKLGQEIRTFPGMKDGGSVKTYDVLKLINDTMNDG
jgi:hypothetical protein